MSALDGILDGADDPMCVQYASAADGPVYFDPTDVLEARAELATLRACESWILEHAQHGARCPYWGEYEKTDKNCTCGLAEIMGRMP